MTQNNSELGSDPRLLVNIFTDKNMQHADARLSVVWLCPVCDNKNDDPDFVGDFNRVTHAVTYCAFCQWPVTIGFGE